MKLTKRELLLSGFGLGLASILGYKKFLQSRRFNTTEFIPQDDLAGKESQELMIGDSMAYLCDWKDIDKIAFSSLSLYNILGMCKNAPNSITNKNYSNVYLFAGTSDLLIPTEAVSLPLVELVRVWDEEGRRLGGKFENASETRILGSTSLYRKMSLSDKFKQFCEDYDKLFSYVNRTFKTQVKIISPFPCINFSNCGLVDRVNEYLHKKYFNNYVDVRDKFFKDDCQILDNSFLNMKDRVHLNSEGYKKLRSILLKD